MGAIIASEALGASEAALVVADDPREALASAAAYLSKSGWTKGMPWGVEVALPEGFDYAQTSERVKKPVAEWQAMGVRLADGGALPVQNAGCCRDPT